MIDSCDKRLCDENQTFWAVTQSCGQHGLWHAGPRRRPIVPDSRGFACGCDCEPDVNYCAMPDCISDILRVMRRCAAAEASNREFVTLTGNDGTGSSTCRCPCPHPGCAFCDSDPGVQAYLHQICASADWWPGFPVLLRAKDGAQCVCLCPDDEAKTMSVSAAGGEVLPLGGLAAGDRIAAFGLSSRPAIAEVRAVTAVSRHTPVTGVKLQAGKRRITLSADQLLLTALRRVSPAISIEVGDHLLNASGQEIEVDASEHLPLYGFPLRFVVLGFDRPDAQLSGRLLAVNDFLVGDYSTQVFALLGGMPLGVFANGQARRPGGNHSMNGETFHGG